MRPLTGEQQEVAAWRRYYNHGGTVLPEHGGVATIVEAWCYRSAAALLRGHGGAATIVEAQCYRSTTVVLPWKDGGATERARRCSRGKAPVLLVAVPAPVLLLRYCNVLQFFASIVSWVC